jgi:hypothetical protein
MNDKIKSVTINGAESNYLIQDSKIVVPIQIVRNKPTIVTLQIQ